MNAYISVTNYQACIIHTYIIDKRINLTRKHRIKYETVKKNPYKDNRNGKLQNELWRNTT